MIILKAHKFRLKPTPEQEALLHQYAGCARFVYNQALSLQINRYDQSLKKLTYPELAKELVEWKKQDDRSFLKVAPSQILQQKLMDLEKAYTNFFQKRAGFPRFRKRGIHDTFRFPDADQIKLEQHNNRIQFPKIGWIQYNNSQKIDGTVKNVTLSCKAGKWYMSVQTEQDVEIQPHSSQSIVGIDLGIARFLTASDGTVIASNNSLKKRLKKLRKEQKSLARKQKRSANRRKQQKKVAKVHLKVANSRNDFIHKATTLLSKNHAVIVVEDLQVKNMSASARGSLENPGRNVRAKSGLNREILDQGWSEFCRQLDYKQRWRGGKVVVVPPQYTSQKCSCCGYISPENRQSQAVFECQSCGYKSNADLNAAKNILAAGHAVIACGEEVRPKVVRQRTPEAASMKQEPLRIQAAA